jgi:hypothetical protein
MKKARLGGRHAGVELTAPPANRLLLGEFAEN